MKVLIAIDGSEFSNAVIEEVARRNWHDGTEFLVLNVVAIPTEQHWQDWGLGVDPDLIHVLRKEAMSLVENTVSVLRPQLGLGCSIRSATAEGHASECIVDTAKIWHADLIMLGSNGAGWLPQFIIGSVAQRVLLQAPCTVEITRAKKEHKHEDDASKKRPAAA